MATITYNSPTPSAGAPAAVSVTVDPASDAESIVIPLGFHPSAIFGVKNDGAQVATLYWQKGMGNFIAWAGSNFDEPTPADGAGLILGSVAEVGPTPLIGDGVSKERTQLGIRLYGGNLVEQGKKMYLTFVA